MVLIVHGSQEAQAWATIHWDNVFFEVNRNPFEFVKEMQWTKMALELRKKFEAQTGCRLIDENLDYLCKFNPYL